MDHAYITGIGKFLPGPLISNDAIEDYIGRIHGISSRVRKAILRRNGICGRHYAIDTNGVPQHSNASMAALAVQSACAEARRDVSDLEFLATSTTQGDLLVPGFASAVHGELGAPPLEIASFQSVCASSMMAIRSAYLNVRAGGHKVAAASGSEFSSRWFRPGFYESIVSPEMAAEPPGDLEFLRWTLSDGAGALIIEPKPGTQSVSLRIDWIEIKSFANSYGTCMYAGKPENSNPEARTWSHYASPGAAYEAGSVTLRQDFKMLHRMFTTWAGFFMATLDKHRVDPENIAYFLPHYSAESLGQEMRRLLSRTGALIPEERWFTTLRESGNIGSASIFVMLEKLMTTRSPVAGETILCFVPESGQCLAGLMHLTAV